MIDREKLRVGDVLVIVGGSVPPGEAPLHSCERFHYITDGTLVRVTDPKVPNDSCEHGDGYVIQVAPVNNDQSCWTDSPRVTLGRTQVVHPCQVAYPVPELKSVDDVEAFLNG